MRCSPSRKIRSQAGFTLIELLIVMAIIAILIAISIPAVMKAREVANRSACANNLRQMGVASWAYHGQLGHFPTAGVSDFAAPTYATSSTSIAPIAGWQQDAGWGFQILPYMDEENVWTGGAFVAGSPGPPPVVGSPVLNMQNALKTPVKFYFCPTRRVPSNLPPYINSSFPGEAAYASVKGKAFTVFPSDYAACNGTVGGDGIVLSQALGRSVVQSTDIKDGLAHTLLLGEKAANPHLRSILNEDDQGYASGFSGSNLNTIRFTSPSLLPLLDVNVTGPTGGAFGGSHFSSWNALMADGSVRSLTYSIDSLVFAALGTINGQELISDADLSY